MNRKAKNTIRHTTKVYVLGSYGCMNRGDEAILASLIDYFPDNCEICVSNGKYDDMRKYFPVKTQRCRLAEGRITLEWAFEMALDSFHQLFQIIRSDLLVYGGGSNIHDLTPYNLPYMFFWSTAARLFGSKIVFAGMGIGPINTKRGKRLIQKKLSKADIVFARDMRGYNICKSLGLKNVKYSCDLAFYKTKQEKRDKDEDISGKDEYITISVCAWFESENFWNRANMDFSKQIDSLIKFLINLKNRTSKRLLFVPTFGYDEEIGERICTILGRDVITCMSKGASYLEFEEIISKAYMHVGMRMHSLIFALKANVPIIPVIYDKKVSELVRRFQLEEYALRIDEINSSRSYDILERIEDDREGVIEIITNKSKEMEKLASEQLKTICEFI